MVSAAIAAISFNRKDAEIGSEASPPMNGSPLDDSRAGSVILYPTIH